MSLFIFWRPLKTLVDYSLWENSPYDQYSYTMVIPFIVLALAFVERREIFTEVQYCFCIGISLLLTALILSWVVGFASDQLGAGDSLSLKIFALVIFWFGGFLLCYGRRAVRAGAFPLLFLLLAVPLPDWLLEKPVTAVQYGSTEVCSLIFSLIGVPALRNGFVFSLANVTIEVAKECSGIHSTLAIFIISLLAGHLFLASLWKNAVLVSLALPIVCVTNGLRIAGLTLLAEYVNPGVLHSNLHHHGGIGFFSLALLFLFVILHLLRRKQSPETRRSKH